MFIEVIKAIFLGIIQGITEWLPISSTGHMILFDSLWPLNPQMFSKDFVDMFLVVIQFASILAVILLFFHKLNPFSSKKTTRQKKATFSLWGKVIVGCFPAAFIGLFLDDYLHDHLYNAVTVAIMLILYGIWFILVENRQRKPRISSFDELTYQTALLIGCFQVLALIPGTSRSGATILGAIVIGTSRYIATEYSFFLAIPVMFGASLLKLAKYFVHFGIGFTLIQWAVLLSGMATAFIVSIFAIRFLMRFIQKHTFKPFGVYRIFLGILVLLLFFVGVVHI